MEYQHDQLCFTKGRTFEKRCQTMLRSILKLFETMTNSGSHGIIFNMRIVRPFSVLHVIMIYLKREQN